MYKFKVGNRVRLVKEHHDSHAWLRTGDEGTVVGGDRYSYKVDWDRPSIVGHDCNGLARNNHGWKVNPITLELVIAKAVLTTQERVINKIKLLDKRFEDRKGINK